MRVISLANFKGGTGKTVTAVNLAALLPGVWTVKTSSEGLAGTRCTARVLILPPDE